MSDLEFERVFTFDKIPRYLIEQVKPKWNVDLLYENYKDLSNSPNILLYVLVNENRIEWPVVKGFLWAIISFYDNMVYVNILSVAREYQGRGDYIRIAIRKVKEVQALYKLDGIRWVTTRPKAFEKYGFRKSNHVMMEV